MFLETVTGKMVNVIDPKPDQIDINDIAWGLSRQPRFAGHTITEIPYNVAQHSLLVTEIASDLYYNRYDSNNTVQEAIETLQKEGKDESPFFLKTLLHDSAEVYIGDLPSPVKRHPKINEAIREIEGALMATIFDKFSLQPMSESEKRVIKFADMVARAIEAHAFMQSRGRDWNLPEVSLIRLQKFEPPMTSVVSYIKFLEKFNELY
jgi:5'-deoxynucleotidase YfbR-like HD superfamily hydrolase